MNQKPVRYSRKMTLTDTVMTVITDPRGAMEHLLKERESPPYVVSGIIALIVVFVGPIVIYQYRFELEPYSPQLAYALVIALSLTFIVFVLLQGIILRLVGVGTPMIKIVAASVYSLTPFIPLMVGYYIANRIAIGQFSIIPYFVTGQRVHGDWFLDFLPNFMWLGVLSSFLTYVAAIRVVGKMGMPTGYMMGLIAVPTLVGAYVVGLMVSEARFENSAAMVSKTVQSYFQVPD